MCPISLSLSNGVRLNSEQLERLQSNTAELDSRVAAARLETEQLTKQLSQTTIKLASNEYAIVSPISSNN